MSCMRRSVLDASLRLGLRLPVIPVELFFERPDFSCVAAFALWRSCWILDMQGGANRASADASDVRARSGALPDHIKQAGGGGLNETVRE